MFVTWRASATEVGSGAAWPRPPTPARSPTSRASPTATSTPPACACTSPRPARPTRAAPDAPRLAAALVHVAPPDPGARRALPRDRARPARLRLVGRAAPRLRQGDTSPPTSSTCSTRSASSGSGSSATTGAAGCGFLICLRAPERFERFRGAQHPARPGTTPTCASSCALWRFWYMAVLATPRPGWWVAPDSSADSLPRARPRRNRTSGQTRTSRSSPSQLTSRARARATTQLYRTLPHSRVPGVGPGPLRRRSAHRSDAAPLRRGRLRDRKRSLERDFSDHADDLRVEFVEECGHFIAEDRPEMVTRRALEFFAA